MKKITLLISIFIGLVFFVMGCNNVRKDEVLEDNPSLEGIVVGYDHEDRKEIFGNLSLEEIGEVIEKISYGVAIYENYEDHISSIIEKAFKESGINDIDRIDAAKSKLAISKNGQLKITYDVDREKDIFGELSKDEISSILTDIASEIYQDEDYKSNFDSIIDRVFKEYGIEDSSKLNAAKSLITATF